MIEIQIELGEKFHEKQVTIPQVQQEGLLHSCFQEKLYLQIYELIIFLSFLQEPT